MKVPTHELSGKALDFAAFIAKGWSYWLPANAKWDDYTDWILSGGVLKKLYFDGSVSRAGAWIPHDIWQPHCDWSQCGPIIEEVGIDLRKRVPDSDVAHPNPRFAWKAELVASNPYCCGTGETARIAALRCCVDFKLGRVVDIPEECLK